MRTIPTRRQVSADTVPLLRRWAVACVVAGLAAPAFAAEPAARGPGPGDVYSCDGRRSDREMSNCIGAQKRISPSGVVTLLLTPDQQRLVAECKAKHEELMLQWRKNERSDANLRAKYPDMAALKEARDADLLPVRQSVARSRSRLADLDKERQRLALDKEFYPKGAPPDLQRKIDQNDALVTAQQQVEKKALEDVARIEANFDDLEKTMRRLWVEGPRPIRPMDCSPDALFPGPPSKTGRR